ncbi:MAG: hypothetical protein QM817_02105 [Archangium sp.]
MTVPRPKFGPPRNPFGRFAWAVAQLPRAFWWQVRSAELRKLFFLPTIITVIVGFALLGGAAVASGTLVTMQHHDGNAAVVAVGVTLEFLLAFAVLSAAAVFITWHAQSAISAPAFERMTLVVQRDVDGSAPEPAVGALEVMRRALRGFFPRLRSLVLWALTAIAGAALVLVPVFGPVLALGAQVIIASLFLAHGTITDNRTRLGLPRRLLLAEPALVLGLALGLVPLVLLPPLLFFCGGPVAIAGALVALGSRRSDAEDLADRSAHDQP